MKLPSVSTVVLVKKLTGWGITSTWWPSRRIATQRFSEQLGMGPLVAEELVAELVAGGDHHVMDALARRRA